jgi:hypothetical protein
MQPRYWNPADDLPTLPKAGNEKLRQCRPGSQSHSSESVKPSRRSVNPNAGFPEEVQELPASGKWAETRGSSMSDRFNRYSNTQLIVTERFAFRDLCSPWH